MEEKRTTESIYLRALEIEDAAARRRYLESACGRDAQQLAELETRLEAGGGQPSIPIDQAVACLEYEADSPSDRSRTQWTHNQDSQKPQTCRLTLRPGTIIGPYTIRELLGEGGMGQVYVAEQVQPVRRKVALKLIRAVGATPEMIARLEAEGQALALMDHPHIAKVFDMGCTEEGLPYLAMELVRGLPITEYADVHELRTEERLELFSQVCEAVRHAHLHGLIHRDLKPGNVLVSDIDGKHVPKVIDFGLAKAIEQPLSDKTIYTGFHRMVGTPMYMSPEQAGMGVVDIDTRSDVYSMGVLLFELLTGTTPFDRDVFRSANYDEVRRMIREVDPPKPSTAIDTLPLARASTIAQRRRIDPRRLRIGLRGDLDWIVMKALEKNRDRRYESVSGLAADVRRFLNHQNVLACPPSTWYRLKKFVHRHKLFATVASTILLALTVTAGITTRENLLKRRAEADSLARWELAANLLEAMRYQSALQLLQRGELHRLADQLDAWKTGDRTTSFQNPLSQPADRPLKASLMQLLDAWARPQAESEAEHHVAIHNLAIAPTGNQFITVDEAGQVIQWSVTATGGLQPIRTLGAHREASHAIAISPDGSQAVSGSTTGHLIFWDLATDNQDEVQIRRIQPLQTGVETIVWSPDGHHIAAGARYSEVWVANADGEEEFRIANDQRHEALLFSMDSRELFVPTRGGIHVWDVRKGKRRRTIDTRPLENVRTMCLAGENHQWLVAGERHHEMFFLFDVATGDIKGHIDCAAEYARSLSVSPNGQHLAASYDNGQIQLFKLQPQEPAIRVHRANYQFQAHRAILDSRLPVAWRDDNSFLSAARNGSLRDWKLDTVRHWEEIRSESLPHVCGAYLLDDSDRPKILPYDHLRDSEAARQLNEGAEFPPGMASRNAADGLLAVVHEQQISIVSIDNGKVLLKIPSSIAAPHTLLFSAQAEALYASDSRQLQVWRSDDRWTTYETLPTVELERESFVHPAFADAGRTLVLSQDSAGKVIELDVATGQKQAVYQFLGDTNSLAVSHDGKYLAHCHEEGLQVLERATSEIIFTRNCLSQPALLAFMPDDLVLLSAHHNGSLQATHVPTGNLLGQLFKPHSPIGRVTNLDVAADGRIAISYQAAETRVPFVLGY